MDDELQSLIQAAAAKWAEGMFRTSEIVIGEAAADDEETDEEAVRYLVDYAIRDIGFWQVAEVWVAGGRVLSVNDLGEGIPLDNARWPWPDEEIA
jgi:hypothetical protein